MAQRFLPRIATCSFQADERTDPRFLLHDLILPDQWTGQPFIHIHSSSGHRSYGVSERHAKAKFAPRCLSPRVSGGEELGDLASGAELKVQLAKFLQVTVKKPFQVISSLKFEVHALHCLRLGLYGLACDAIWHAGVKLREDSSALEEWRRSRAGDVLCSCCSLQSKMPRKSHTVTRPHIYLKYSYINLLFFSIASILLKQNRP